MCSDAPDEVDGVGLTDDDEDEGVKTMKTEDDVSM